MPTVVMISVDGERDSPAAMKSYLEPLSPTFIGLTGDPRTSENCEGIFRRLLQRSARRRIRQLPGRAHEPVYLLDNESRLRATFFDATVDEMAAIDRSSSSRNRSEAPDCRLVALPPSARFPALATRVPACAFRSEAGTTAFFVVTAIGILLESAAALIRHRAMGNGQRRSMSGENSNAFKHVNGIAMPGSRRDCHGRERLGSHSE